MTSPVAALISSVQPKMSGGEFSGFFDDERRGDVLKGVFNSYYARTIPGLAPDPIIFDTNRIWTGRAALLAELYPASKIICCVRDIGWIIDSIEKMLSKNPIQLSRMFNFLPGASVYARTESLMNADNGLIGLAWSNLREAWFGDHAKNLIIISYDELVKRPDKTMRALYAELAEHHFDHDFNNLQYDEPNYDSHIGMPGLHTVRSQVKYQNRLPCIPPDVFSKYAGSHFWERAEMNTRKVKIL